MLSRNRGAKLGLWQAGRLGFPLDIEENVESDRLVGVVRAGQFWCWLTWPYWEQTRFGAGRYTGAIGDDMLMAVRVPR
jgi:hypothetical protein